MTRVELEPMYIIFDAKASPVAKDLVDSIDGQNHTILASMDCLRA